MARLLAVFSFSGVLVATACPQPAVADPYNCSCVTYARSKTGLLGGPPTAAGYTETAMNERGYVRVSPRPGTIMVWDRNRKGAGAAGHMAIVTGAAYNGQTRKWTIDVRHVNWNGNCGEHPLRFTGASGMADWGNLDGVNFYFRR
ncbi:CHAP domain-containing protein [Virgisporangium ochraceum]|nr:CHAP domain-containing protein [Virgisporangium ochraceum]